MKEAFEKILERLEESSVCEDNRTCNYCQRNWCPLLLIERDEVEKIVNEVSEEYNNDWIPCSERLPKESLNSVIGWDEYRQRCCFVQYYGGRWIIGNDIDSVKIIAWQPLPEPYQPKGE